MLQSVQERFLHVVDVPALLVRRIDLDLQMQGPLQAPDPEAGEDGADPLAEPAPLAADERPWPDPPVVVVHRRRERELDLDHRRAQ
ncbi:hypothetical protein RZS08_45635, partial [Arthrospira platensis SPKY1]|nr:hypothetical protein [Arthrospira platensis SPKY1]